MKKFIHTLIASAILIARLNAAYVTGNESLELAPHSPDGFGSDVGIYGAGIVVGSPGTTPADAGEISIYASSHGQCLKILSPNDTQAGDLFGSSVDIEGHTVLAGAPGVSAAYVFDYPTSEQLFKLEPDSGELDFGRAAATTVTSTQSILAVIGGRDAAYIFDLDSGTRIHKLTAPSGSFNFGKSVDIYDEYVVVGSTGAAYVFRRDTGQLIHSFIGTGTFGFSVSLNADSVAVGSHGASSGTGEVSVFDLQSGNLETTLISNESTPNQNFGYALDFSSQELFVGAPGDQHNGIASGSCYVFDTEDFSLDRKLYPATPTPNGNFGQSIDTTGSSSSIGGFLANQGRVFHFINPISIDTSGFDSVDESAGTIQVEFSISQTISQDISFSYQAIPSSQSALVYIEDLLPNPHPLFPAARYGDAINGQDYVAAAGSLTIPAGATSVSLSINILDDMVGEQTEMFAIEITGAHNASKSSIGNQKFVKIIDDDPCSFQLVRDLGQTGSSVDIYRNSVVIGHQNDKKAYVYDVSNGQLVYELTGDPGDVFGSHVAIAGRKVVIGTLSNAVYVFDLETGQRLYRWAPSDPSATPRFGWRVAAHNNLALIGTDSRTNGGSAYLFDLNTGQQLHIWESSTEHTFGMDVALTDTYALISSKGIAPDTSNPIGQVSAFDLSTKAFSHTISSSNPAASGYGLAVSSYNDLALVTAPSADFPAINAGAIYLHQISTGNQLLEWTRPDDFGAHLIGYKKADINSRAIAVSPLSSLGKTYVIDHSGQLLAKLPYSGDIALSNNDSGLDERYLITGAGLVYELCSSALPLNSSYAYWDINEQLSVYNSGPTDDPDADGLSNLLEYALNSSPQDNQSGNSILPYERPSDSVSSNDFCYVVQLPQPARDDIIYKIEISDDMSSWTTHSTKSGSSAWTGGNPYMETIPGMVSFCVSDPAPLGTRSRFMRLKVDLVD